MQTLLQDLRLAIRLVAKNPASSAVIVVTLGLGIGATTAIFSMVNAVLLRPLPYPQADQLVQVRKEWQPPWLNQPETTTGMAFREVLAWRQDAQRLLEIAEYQAQSASLARGDEAELVTCGRVSASFLPVLGIAPARGREFLPDEDRPGGPAVAILSHALWQRDFGMASDIVGQTIRLDDRPYLVVGVLPPGFRFTESYDVLLPLALRQGDLLAAPEVIGRLKAGTRPEQARHALDAIYQRVRDPRENGRIQVVNLHDHVVGNVRPSLLVYQMAVAFVLLIACANVANLLLARAVNRHKEMAIRLALGAGRMRLVRQLLTESLLLAALGALLGLLLALWGKDFLQSFVGTLPKLPAVRIDGWVLGVTLLMTVLTGVFCGLAPAMEASGGALTDRLKHGASGSTNAIVRQRHLTGLFVVLEVTLAVLLLVGSGLLIRSYLRLSGVNLGFHPDRILSLTIDLVKSRYPDARSQTTYFEQVIERLQLLPGVEAVGANVALPLTDAKMGFMETGAVSGRNIVSSGGIVSAGYFRTLGIPLRKGRWFADQDRRGAPLVVVVNESFVQRYFPDEEPLGKNVAGRTVIGVVGDVKAQGPMSAAESELYFHYLQAVDPNPSTERMSLAVRTRGDPMKLAGTVRAQIMSVDKDQKCDNLVTLEQRLSDKLTPQRLKMLLATGLGALALALAGLGIYAVLSFSITQRTHEIGVRMALGARKWDILRLVMRQGFILTIAGMVFGLMAAFGLTQFLESFLFEVETLDLTTFLAASIFLGLVASLACYLPARNASLVDPIAALRRE